MILVRVELESARGAKYNRVLGFAAIANDGKGTRTRGNYQIALQHGQRGEVRQTRVENFPRRSRSVFELLRRALNELERMGNLP